MKQILMQMIEDICKKHKASRDEVANFIGKTESQFNNCLYQTNGQQFRIADILAMQQRYGVTHYTDWVCEQSGGVFLPVNEKVELDKTELFDLLVAENGCAAHFNAFYQQALKDGRITPEEAEMLKRLHLKVFQAQSNRLYASFILFSD